MLPNSMAFRTAHKCPWYYNPPTEVWKTTKITNEVLKKIDDAMLQDDETTAKELVTKLRADEIFLTELLH